MSFDNIVSLGKNEQQTAGQSATIEISEDFCTINCMVKVTGALGGAEVGEE